MGVGLDPLLLVLRDAIATEVDTIDHDAEGYHFNYGAVKKGSSAWFGTNAEPLRPVPHLAYAGALGGPLDDRGGNERGYSRFRDWSHFILSFAVEAPDGDHDRMAMRILADMHFRLMDPTRRKLGDSDSVNRGGALLTWLPPDWFPASLPGDDDDEEEGGVEGGILHVNLGLRHDHVSGDMSIGTKG